MTNEKYEKEHVKLTRTFAVGESGTSHQAYVHLQGDVGKQVMPHKNSRYSLDRLPEQLADLRKTNHKMNYILNEKQLLELYLGKKEIRGLIRRVLGIDGHKHTQHSSLFPED